MEEQSDEQEQHPPRWVPYTPPPPDGWDRVGFLLRRLSFPFVVLLLGLGVAAVFYWNAQLQPTTDTTSGVNVVPSQVGVGDGAENAAMTGSARLSVRSTPPGATVRVNGDSVGVTPFADSAQPAGVYMLSVQARGHFRSDTVVVLEEGTASTVRFSLRRRPDFTDSGPPESRSSRAASSSDRETEQEDRSLPVTSVPSAADEAPRPRTPAYGALYVTSTPTGATVSVDGTERGRTPLPVSKVPPGTKRVSMGLDGYEPWSSRVPVTADTTTRVHADLQKRVGRLRVLAQPWGTIYIDGTLHARESDVWYETELPVGRHEIRVVHPVLGTQVRQVGVRAGEETSVTVNLRAQEEGDSSP